MPVFRVQERKRRRNPKDSEESTEEPTLVSDTSTDTSNRRLVLATRAEGSSATCAASSSSSSTTVLAVRAGKAAVAAESSCTCAKGSSESHDTHGSCDTGGSHTSDARQQRSCIVARPMAARASSDGQGSIHPQHSHGSSDGATIGSTNNSNKGSIKDASKDSDSTIGNDGAGSQSAYAMPAGTSGGGANLSARIQADLVACGGLLALSGSSSRET